MGHLLVDQIWSLYLCHCRSCEVNQLLECQAMIRKSWIKKWKRKTCNENKGQEFNKSKKGSLASLQISPCIHSCCCCCCCCCLLNVLRNILCLLRFKFSKTWLYYNPDYKQKYKLNYLYVINSNSLIIDCRVAVNSSVRQVFCICSIWFRVRFVKIHGKFSLSFSWARYQS